MYARSPNDADEEPLFAVSGLLWRNSLVMVDVSTGSLWHQLSGRAVAGPRKGEQLKQLPSVLTDWQSWKRAHPETTVVLLARTSHDYDRAVYDYLGPFVIGIRSPDGEPGSPARAWPFRELLHRPAINDGFQGAPVLVTFDRRSHTANVFSRVLEMGGAPQTQQFELRDGVLTDRETHSRWNPLTGVAESGPAKGRQLKRIAATVSYLRPWTTFFPSGSIYPAPDIE